jgi:hypothetical protein
MYLEFLRVWEKGCGCFQCRYIAPMSELGLGIRAKYAMVPSQSTILVDKFIISLRK